LLAGAHVSPGLNRVGKSLILANALLRDCRLRFNPYHFATANIK
jgi:hypothetical protein